MSDKPEQSDPIPTTETPTATADIAPESGEMTPAEIEHLKELAAQADDYRDKYLRAIADHDNYRKRMIREREELTRSVSEQTVAALLPVLDNLERALKAADEHGTEHSALREGVQQVYNQFRRTMEELGLQEIAAHTGSPFDPSFHEAIGQSHSEDHPDGHILELTQRGYKLSNRLLRPARVVVSKGSATAAGSSHDQT
jgi:molecular chaperone GrpE